jgi:hypothetical protein
MAERLEARPAIPDRGREVVEHTFGSIEQRMYRGAAPVEFMYDEASRRLLFLVSNRSKKDGSCPRVNDQSPKPGSSVL